jgi:hypothetical protein
MQPSLAACTSALLIPERGGSLHRLELSRSTPTADGWWRPNWSPTPWPGSPWRWPSWPSPRPSRRDGWPPKGSRHRCWTPGTAARWGHVLLGAVLAAGLCGLVGVGVAALVRNQVAALVGTLVCFLVVEGLLMSLLHAPSLGK